MNDILMLIISTLVIGTVFSITFLGKPFGFKDGDEKRAFLHICAGSWGVLWLFFESRMLATGFVLLIVTMVFATAFLARSQYAVLAGGRVNKIYEEINFGNERFLGIALYMISMLVITFLLWDAKLIGSLAILALSLGDGFADIIGKKYGKRSYKLPWVKTKTYMGSFAGLLATYIGSVVFLLAILITDPGLFSHQSIDVFGYLIFDLGDVGRSISGSGGISVADIISLKLTALFIALAAAITEAISPYHTDNFTIPLVVIVVALFLI